MAASDDPPDGAECGPELYRSDPFLIVYGSGPRSKHVAREITATQCEARGVHADVRSIEEIDKVTLFFYLALIVVLPSVAAPDVAGALRPFERLIFDYRKWRPNGLKSLREGSCAWYAPGVVQVCGLRVVMDHPQTKALLDGAAVCAKHYIDEFGPAVDIFRSYHSGFLPLSNLSPRQGAYQELIRKAWRTIQDWGVTDIEEVPTLKQCIDKCRHHYEKDRFSALYRPNPNAPNSNMLDLILDGPHDVVGDRTTWLENAARVCRHVRQQLKEEMPGLEQPGARRVQEQLRKLYQSLRIVELAMGDPGGSGLPSRPS